MWWFYKVLLSLKLFLITSLLSLVSGCDGAPLLPLLYIVTNLAFNIFLLNVVKISSAVVASLAVMLSGALSLSLSLYMCTYVHVCIYVAYVYKSRLFYNLFANGAFCLICSANFNLYSFPPIAISFRGHKLEPLFSLGQCDSCIRSYSVQHTPAYQAGL
jgi:hypothetical protein